MSSSPPSESRSFVGKYQIVDHIATGGMGAVYKATDTDSGREVALKVLAHDLADNPVMRERFRREAAHGVKLIHENLVAIHDYGETQGTCYLAMEYVHGRTLARQIERQGPLAPAAARQIMLQMTAALEYIHEQGLIHRDIKPSNILLTRRDGKVIAKLADLGLIREARDDEFRLTREGTTVGTVDYLAPEQARDSGAADIRSDIYSLGCTLYHMLTGEPPFTSGNLTERLFKHAEVDPPDVRNKNPKIPAFLAAVCRRMLAKKPDDRFQTPADLRVDLTTMEISPETPASSAALDADAASTEPTLVINKRPRKRAPDSPAELAAAGRFDVAQKALAAGDGAYAIGLMLECCRDDPGSVEYRHALRETYQQLRTSGRMTWRVRWQGRLSSLIVKAARRMGHWQKVLFHGERVLGLRPRDLPMHLLVAEAAMHCRQRFLAQWLLEQAQQNLGDHVLIHRALALFWEKQEDIKQAMGFWELVVRAEPDHAEARHHLRNLSARTALHRSRHQQLPDEIH